VSRALLASAGWPACLTRARGRRFRRVADALAAAGHAHSPRWLDVAARTSQEPPTCWASQWGQIAKSVVFRRRDDGRAVLVVTSGDKRVDESRVAAITGTLARADAQFVKQQTGFRSAAWPRSRICSRQ
jgi:prolyl-tRNA editing enzyme YbaK/EbsC (Cys-tRNA(Pro) deacylase)